MTFKQIDQCNELLNKIMEISNGKKKRDNGFIPNDIQNQIKTNLRKNKNNYEKLKDFINLAYEKDAPSPLTDIPTSPDLTAKQQELIKKYNKIVRSE